MRLRGLMVLGALAMGAAGCGESVGPPAEGRDLEFVAPVTRSGVDPSLQRSWDEPITDAERQRLDARLAAETVDEVLPALLFSKYVTGEWNQNSLTMSYGMLGAGTGYTMSPKADFRARDGRLLESRNGLGRSEDQPIYWYMRPASSETVTIADACGVTAVVNVTFEVRSTGFSLGEPRTYRNVDIAQTNTDQPNCSQPGGGSGGGSSGTTYVNDGTRIWLCYYEVWMDLDGDVIDVFFFGCSEVGGLYLAE